MRLEVDWISGRGSRVSRTEAGAGERLCGGCDGAGEVEGGGTVAVEEVALLAPLALLVLASAWWVRLVVILRRCCWGVCAILCVAALHVRCRCGGLEMYANRFALARRDVGAAMVLC